MPKRRPQKRNYKTITLKIYFDSDQDIIDWWDSVEEGERSDSMRALIRQQIGGSRKAKPPILDLTELLEVRRDTLWIRDTLNDMPAYLERVIQHVAASAAQTVIAPPPHQVERLTADDAGRRANRMKAQW